MRVHDSGDFQSEGHVLNWFAIVRATLNTRYWAPSREIELFRAALRRVLEAPENFTVRISSPIIGDPPLEGMPHTLTVRVTRKNAPAGVYT